MARARLLKIGLFKNEDLAQLPYEDRLMFCGTWLLADRAGRLLDKPRRIGAELFPYEQVDANAMLQRLHDAGFIVRYEVGGERYIAIRKFLTHQSPHVKEHPSEIPPIPQSLGSTRVGTGQASDEPQASPSVSISDPVPMRDPVPVSVSIPDPETGTVSRDKREADLRRFAKRTYELTNKPEDLIDVFKSVVNLKWPKAKASTVTEHEIRRHLEIEQSERRAG
jgi:hypothetical protein